MKGLLKYMSPFAPDQSGAASVLYDMGGLTVICDAGGCTGNICGFDEPRWFGKKSALMSAGLRDMDAILGRDDAMVAKIRSAADHMDAAFVSLIGTPVPAVIATDFKALARMTEKRTGLPAIAVECTGTRLYDEGESDTWLALFKKFAVEPQTQERILGVIGLTPLSVSRCEVREALEAYAHEAGYEDVVCYGMGDGLEAVKKAASVSYNLVVSPAGLKAARYLEEKFEIPYGFGFPLMAPALMFQLFNVNARRILIVHQQVAANDIRSFLTMFGHGDVTVAGFFMMTDDLRQPQDVQLTSEQDWQQLVREGGFDLIIADQALRRAVPDYQGQWLHVPHFAVSGELENENTYAMPEPPAEEEEPSYADETAYDGVFSWAPADETDEDSEETGEDA